MKKLLRPFDEVNTGSFEFVDPGPPVPIQYDIHNKVDAAIAQRVLVNIDDDELKDDEPVKNLADVQAHGTYRLLDGDPSCMLHELCPLNHKPGQYTVSFVIPSPFESSWDVSLKINQAKSRFLCTLGHHGVQKKSRNSLGIQEGIKLLHPNDPDINSFRGVLDQSTIWVVDNEAGSINNAGAVPYILNIAGLRTSSTVLSVNVDYNNVSVQDLHDAMKVQNSRKLRLWHRSRMWRNLIR